MSAASACPPPWHPPRDSAGGTITPAPAAGQREAWGWRGRAGVEPGSRQGTASAKRQRNTGIFLAPRHPSQPSVDGVEEGGFQRNITEHSAWGEHEYTERRLCERYPNDFGGVRGGGGVARGQFRGGYCRKEKISPPPGILKL